jgi:arginase
MRVVSPPPTEPGQRDPATLTLNAEAIASWSPRLADAIGAVLDRGEFPLILGGDCSILLGAMLALKRRGRFGLLFVDGHADFYQPEANPNGEAASMELAFAMGHGPTLLADLEGRGPLVGTEDAVASGFRDADEQRRYGSQPLPTETLAPDINSVRRMGVERATALALERVSHPSLDGFFRRARSSTRNRASTMSNGRGLKPAGLLGDPDSVHAIPCSEFADGVGEIVADRGG